MFYAHNPALDSGATGNMICHTIVQRLGCQVTPSSQSIHQADGSSPLHVVGETRFPFTPKGHTFTFCLVVENLDIDVLAGTPFMESNDIAVRPTKRQVILGDVTIHNYGSQQPVTINSTARRAIVLRSPPTSTAIWPGEFWNCGQMPPGSQLWPQPTMASSVAGKICIPNLTPEPHFLKRNEHFCQVHALYKPEAHSTSTQLPVSPPPKPPVHPPSTKHSVNVTLDPNNLLPQDVRAKFTSLLDEYDNIFDPNIKA